MKLTGFFLISSLAVALIIAGGNGLKAGISQPSVDTVKDASTNFEQDRLAILAMVGNYKVTFDFIETVPFVEDYTLKDRKASKGHEVVRVIEDRGDYISLQHILVAGDHPVKHWRQDWYYEPDSVLVYIGGNAWKKRSVTAAEAKRNWSQIVYQVDDSPRYGALGSWTHANGVSQWESPREWRPLPRRDATTRDDYHVINGVNRHAITPFGWVHEQDNAKINLAGKPQILVREIAVNTYRKSDDFKVDIAETYWNKTAGYWAGVRDMWNRIEAENNTFGLTVQGEAEGLYNKILGLAQSVASGSKPEKAARTESQSIISSFVTSDIEPLEERLASQ